MENSFHMDERFGSFYERLNSLRFPGESDKDFAERMGVKLRRFQGWKYEGKIPQPWTAYMWLSSKLCVGRFWLAYGWDSPEWGPLSVSN